MPAVDSVLPAAIDEVINEMFPPLRETGVSDDIEVVGLASKEMPLYEVETVVAACAPFGSSDMFIDSGEDKDNHSGNKVGGAMSTNMEARLILGRFQSKQASLTSPPLFAQQIKGHTLVHLTMTMMKTMISIQKKIQLKDSMMMMNSFKMTRRKTLTTFLFFVQTLNLVSGLVSGTSSIKEDIPSLT